MTLVRPKKQYGQHFLKDLNIARNIVDSLTFHNSYKHIVEVGAGTGVLTRILLENTDIETWVVEVDHESVVSLNASFPALQHRLVEGDFLKFKPSDYFENHFGIIGNFPYNISTQILFRVLDMRDNVPEVVGMFQKEVAQRIASPPGSKQYGILSVLLKAWYNIEFLFSVPPQVFYPAPKVQSAVIRLVRNDVTDMGCDEILFVKVVKAGFNQRRKTLRNSLKSIGIVLPDTSDKIFDKRAEELSVADFVRITLMFQEARFDN